MELTVTEMKSSIQFCLDSISEYKKRGLEIPDFIFEMIIKAQSQLIEKLENELAND